jgi:hypothetical protein
MKILSGSLPNKKSRKNIKVLHGSLKQTRSRFTNAYSVVNNPHTLAFSEYPRYKRDKFTSYFDDNDLSPGDLLLVRDPLILESKIKTISDNQTYNGVNYVHIMGKDNRSNGKITPFLFLSEENVTEAFSNTGLWNVVSRKRYFFLFENKIVAACWDAEAGILDNYKYDDYLQEACTIIKNSKASSEE